MVDFLSGAVMTACAACGLYFLKFWRSSHDRLFLLFGVAFLMMAFERWALILYTTAAENRFGVYVFRLVAFTIIIAAIVDKNRKG